MPAGFQLTRPNGVTVIDQNYSNLALRTSGSVAINSPVSYVGFENEVTVPGVRSLIAYRSDTPAVLVRSVVSGGNLIHRFRTQFPGTVSYWVFDEAQYGTIFQDTRAVFQIFKPNSTELAFDSRMRYMKFLDTVLINGDVPYPSLNYPGRLPALILASFRSDEASVILTPTSPPDWAYFYTGMFPQASGSSVNWTSVSAVSPVQQGGYPEYHAYSGQSAYTIIDINGM